MQVELRIHANGGSKHSDIPEWLDEDFLQLCMQSGEGDPTIRVMKHDVTLMRLPSSAHSTVMYRVSVEFKRRPRSRNILDFKPQETRSLIIKLLPKPTEFTELHQEVDKEVTALSVTLPAITKILGLFALTAQCFYSEKSPRALIVMDDLTKSDFVRGKMDRQRGLDFNHCMLVMQSMAALHAGSVALYEKDKSSMNPFDHNRWCKEGNSMTKDLVSSTVSDLADEVATWSNFGDKYADRIRALRDTLLPRVNAAISREGSKFNVLNHGGCWYNNLMFRYNSKTSRVEEALLVDFANSVFASPVIDLQHFLFSTPTDEVRLHNVNRLIQHYHRELVLNLEKLKVKTKPPTKEELMEEMEERGAYSVLVAFTLLPIITAEGSTSTDILTDPHIVSEKRKMYANEQFKISLKRLLQIFDSRGHLE
ncbi:Ecdysteroid Kinase 14 [Neodiprion lecontei]|uniref:Uncharacterized protein LOC107227874 n=1 Tax=Neodiprion lecontei TaxID=441921 RepID=A0A6J0CDE4_NEOLC|nr:uncharacterized protein LOC107227874 [Neodiprion lecontei]XP_046472410.1 uncharacterized protein LOC124214241 [Neodiprion pinetum]XP_046610277.1 uncharacterized protein LOC124300347 [Neodiprion virginianus]KAJ4016096.1 Ecdysteroid Kinase 14 [Neodiprion lecontei]